jgi:hypothetical protein
MEPEMRSLSRHPVETVSCSPSLAGIIACLGALASEAKLIGDAAAANVLLDAVQKLQVRLKLH